MREKTVRTVSESSTSMTRTISSVTRLGEGVAREWLDWLVGITEAMANPLGYGQAMPTS